MAAFGDNAAATFGIVVDPVVLGDGLGVYTVKSHHGLRAFFEEIPEFHAEFGIAAVEADHDKASVLFPGGSDGFKFFFIESERFFHKDVFAVLESFDYQGSVEAVSGYNAHAVDFRIFHDFMVIGSTVFKAVFLGNRFTTNAGCCGKTF